VIVLLVIDMQAGLFGEESPRHDAEGWSTASRGARADRGARP